MGDENPLGGMTKVDWGKTALKDLGVIGGVIYMLLPQVQKHGDKIDDLQAQISEHLVEESREVADAVEAAKNARERLRRRVDHNQFSIAVLAGKDDTTLPGPPNLSMGAMMEMPEIARDYAMTSRPRRTTSDE